MGICATTTCLTSEPGEKFGGFDFGSLDGEVVGRAEFSYLIYLKSDGDLGRR